MNKSPDFGLFSSFILEITDSWIMAMKGLSLRYKILAALTVIPLVCLSLFLALAIRIFERDKIAYVFDSSLSVSKNRAARVNSEVATMISLTQAIVLTYRSDTKDLSATGNHYFEREKKFEAFQIHALTPESAGYNLTVDLKKPTGGEVVSASSVLIKKLIEEARDRGVVVRNHSSAPEKLFLAARFGQASDPRHVVAIALFEASDLSRVFTESGAHVGFLATRKDGGTLFLSEGMTAGWEPAAILAQLSSSRAPESIAEISSPVGTPFLASYSEAGVADLIVVSMVEKSAALSAVARLLRNSLLFFVSLIAATTIIAVLASRGLTSALSRLGQATSQIASGDFDVRVEEVGGGEIGQLASSFNVMAEEVSRLMMETAEKARMESELATARTVQETLFPAPSAKMGAVRIRGHYMPASECGGDWWYYFENSDRVFIWIGDATGHGAPAALLTSAARAVASVINLLPSPTAGEALSILNRAICETSKGKMMMTFFLASLDKNTGELMYANASHEPPLLVRAKQDGSEISRDDFMPLNEVNNPRLGEQQYHNFAEGQTVMGPGDRLVFYTDGLVDAKNHEQKSWGERRFLKTLASFFTSGQSPDATVEGVITSLDEFRAETPLDDDVTLVLCEFGDNKTEAA